MISPRQALVGLWVAVALAGCAGGHSGENAIDTKSTEAVVQPSPIPDLQEIDGASSAATEPAPLASKLNDEAVKQSSRADQSRLKAEEFALKFSQVLIDAREEPHTTELLESVSASRMPEGTRQAIVGEVQVQHSAGLGRHWNTQKPMWIRSSVSGNAARPTRVNVEVAGVLAVDDPTYVGWNKVRLDVVWERDAWRLIGLSARPFRPDDLSVNRANADIGDFLDGTGWREIPPPSS